MIATSTIPVPPNRKTGFTLVELLVVIGIIAVLVSILLPSLNAARRQAQAVVCLSNLRTLGQAASQYTNDNKGAVLPAFQSDGASGGVLDIWPFMLMSRRYLPFAKSNGLTGNYNSSTVFWCPSAIGDAASNSGHIFGYYGDYRKWAANANGPARLSVADKLQPGETWFVDVSYGMNGTSNLETGPQSPRPYFRASYPTPVGAAGSRKLDPQLPRKVSAFKNASKIPLIYDGESIHPEGPTFASTNADGSIRNVSILDDRIDGRHGKRSTRDPLSGQTNILFLDGHAAVMARRDIVWGDTSRANIIWCYRR